MTYEITWHGPVEDALYLVEADTEDEAFERLALYLNELTENEGISLSPMKGSRYLQNKPGRPRKHPVQGTNNARVGKLTPESGRKA